MSSKNLPPLSHLPHWTRVGRLGKPRSPPRRSTANHHQHHLLQHQHHHLHLHQHHLQPLPVVPSAGSRAAAQPRHGDAPDPRVASLQSNIQFLQQQHKETLERLHAEVEHLRRENKELQYRMIMEPPKSSRKGPTHGQRGVRPPTQGRDAHTELYLEELLQDTRPTQDQALSVGEGSEILGSTGQDHGPEVKGGLITSLQPLRIHSCPSQSPRAPTLQECEVIIRQLYNANSIQSREIMRVKALLRDIVLSKKISPENHILTKAYLIDGTRKPSEENKFPKLGLQTYPENMSGPSHSGVVLPALKQNLSPTIADRQRRARAVQRERLRRTVH